MRYLLAILAMFLTTPAFAEIKLDAPDSCVVGELVTLDATGSTCERLQWQILCVNSDLDECVDFKPFGKEACFSARASSIWLVIISGVSVEGAPLMLTHKLVVEGNTPEALVKLNLGAKISTWAKLVTSDRDKAMRLAQSFLAISNAEIPADKFLAATAKANKQALGDSLEAWMPFLDKLGAYLDETQLRTTEDYQRTWVEIASGIERAFK